MYRLTASEPLKNQGLVDLQLSCPDKDWLVARESESIDRINPPDWQPGRPTTARYLVDTSALCEAASSEPAPAVAAALQRNERL